MDDDALLDLARRLAAEAAAAISAVRAAGFAVERKSDHSPVTEADRIAEALIVEGLRDAAPHIPVIAEEEIEAGTAPTDPGHRFWLVDPLDGTREFAAGRDNFAVNVGLVADGRPVLGAVALPATGEIFWGRIGAGAFKRDRDGTVRPIAARRPPAEGLTVMGSHHYQDDPRMGRFLEGRHVARIVNIGSAEKFCRVAEGSADLYPRFGRTMEWDTAAPHAVVEAAGGRIRLLEGGGALAYGKRGWANPGFVCEGA
ncbi:3'(2'),5'-bisphosphate nucleotidase CysQ [Roseomonas sp. PWR1]|uniref:3'(2'),5'-bisphosphate nucleotidase CysQ n=1 Tax=Roseomonas nitratireducens TaxID=2820810 RepID=A0ABS4AUW9_9PROT|nr:3'(2'),5'-bisphosphate nucleotidase CysQ [Neoroseomonas nitratireducens]MBP0465150.1 3'(2'),5'-bisphosphate nucleotidase CysQ [Neoroseomonas nitratireducens]